MLYELSIFLVFCYFKLICRIEVEGRNAIPRKGPFILAANHLSNLDPPLLAVFSRRKISFLAKEELFRGKIPSLYLRSVGVVPLRRGNSDIKAMRLALKILKDRPLAIFPQGARGASLDTVSNGVGFLYKKTKVPVIAARIYGTGQDSSQGFNPFKRRKIRIIFAVAGNIEDSDDYEAIARKIMDKIKNL